VLGEIQGEIEAFEIVSTRPENGGDEPDQLSIRRDDGSAGIAGVDGGIDL